MAGECSFDIVSQFDEQELVNALDQTRREVQTRYDLKDTKTEIAHSKTSITILTDSSLTLKNVRDILESKAIRRNLSPLFGDLLANRFRLPDMGHQTLQQTAELSRNPSDSRQHVFIVANQYQSWAGRSGVVRTSEASASISGNTQLNPVDRADGDLSTISFLDR